MSGIEFQKQHSILQQLVGQRVRIDGVIDAIVSSVLGGPVNMYVVAMTTDYHFHYVDIKDSRRIELVELSEIKRSEPTKIANEGLNSE